ncbi:MAG: FtsB family cell division protein [Acetobacteraceae bacterium]
MRAAVAPLVFLALTGYFALNAVEGAHGLIARAKDSRTFSAVRQELSKVTAKRERWEIKVAGLRTDHLDTDLLDERARAMLNLVEPSDIVVEYAPDKRLF